MPYALLRKLKDYEARNLPGIVRSEDRDIVLAVGEAQAAGQRISFKQLDASGICSTATLRRRLYRLTRLGILLRQTSADDRRVSWLVLSRRYQLRFKGYRAALKASLVAMLAADQAARYGRSLPLPAFLATARSPEEFARLLREHCEQFGTIRHVSLSCSQSPPAVFAVVECADAVGDKLAKATGGTSYGQDTVGINYSIPKDFACDFLDRRGSCLLVFR